MGNSVNKLIEQIGGRKRLESIVYAMGAEPCDADPILDSVTHGDIGKMASALLEVLDVKAIGEVRLGDYCEDGTRPAMVACLHDQADWENFADGTKLYTSPPAASVPDGLSAAVNILLDSDGSRGTFSAIRRGDALAEVERLLAAAPAPENKK